MTLTRREILQLVDVDDYCTVRFFSYGEYRWRSGYLLDIGQGFVYLGRKPGWGKSTYRVVVLSEVKGIY